MPKGNTFDNDFLKLIFNATAIANIADNAATAPLTSLYVSLHTADPTSAGNQTSSETAYTGYVRVAVARTSGGFTVTAASVSPAANIDFAECTASPGGAITNFAIGTLTSGTGKILYTGAISPNITMAVGVIPRLKTTSLWLLPPRKLSGPELNTLPSSPTTRKRAKSIASEQAESFPPAPVVR